MNKRTLAAGVLSTTLTAVGCDDPNPAVTGKYPIIAAKGLEAAYQGIKPRLPDTDSKTIHIQFNVKNLLKSVGISLIRGEDQNIDSVQANIKFNFGEVWFTIRSPKKVTSEGNSQQVVLGEKNAEVVKVEEPTKIEEPAKVDFDQLASAKEQLKKDAWAFHTEEPWVKNAQQEVLFAGKVYSKAEAEVTRILNNEKNKALLSMLGLNEMQVNSLKAVITDLAFEFYSKNDFSAGATEKYAKEVIAPNMDSLLNGLKEVFESGDHPYQSTAQLFEAFSIYSGFEFYGKDQFNKDNLRKLLITQRTDLDKLVAGFKQYAAIEKKLAQKK